MADNLTETVAGILEGHRWSIITHCCKCGDPATAGEWAAHAAAVLVEALGLTQETRSIGIDEFDRRYVCPRFSDDREYGESRYVTRWERDA